MHVRAAFLTPSAPRSRTLAPPPASPFMRTPFPARSSSRRPRRCARPFARFYSYTSAPASLRIPFPAPLPAHTRQSAFLFLQIRIYVWSLSYPLCSLSACVTARSYSYTARCMRAPFPMRPLFHMLRAHALLIRAPICVLLYSYAPTPTVHSLP